MFVSEDGGSNVLTAQLALSEIRNPDGTVARFSPPLKQYDWPLRSGKTWNHGVAVHRSNGAIERTFMTGEILGVEPVVTPAGTFSAFRIRVSIGGAVATEWWYAAEAGAPVKRNDRGVVSELVASGLAPDR